MRRCDWLMSHYTHTERQNLMLGLVVSHSPIIFFFPLFSFPLLNPGLKFSHLRLHNTKRLESVDLVQRSSFRSTMLS